MVAGIAPVVDWGCGSECDVMQESQCISSVLCFQSTAKNVRYRAWGETGIGIARGVSWLTERRREQRRWCRYRLEDCGSKVNSGLAKKP